MGTPAKLKLAVLLALTACGGGAAQPGPGDVLTGTVQDVHTREALGGVMVEFADRSTRSDRHGRFRLEGLNLGQGGLLHGSLNDGRAGQLRIRGGPAAATGSLEVLLTLE
ncbi:MAG: hypothetical protein CMK00_02355 [Planctomycetes bacterium]|nr:hypothetical protein [Planctomycetota bacterium]HJO27252.1 hypothetical protein [Planctomycetota bacterium]